LKVWNAVIRFYLQSFEGRQGDQKRSVFGDNYNYMLQSAKSPVALVEKKAITKQHVLIGQRIMGVPSVYGTLLSTSIFAMTMSYPKLRYRRRS
jgi:hypothetical protein